MVRFGGHAIPAVLADLPLVELSELLQDAPALRRVIVVGGSPTADADLAAVLTALLRAGRLDVEVAALHMVGARRARTRPRGGCR